MDFFCKNEKRGRNFLCPVTVTERFRSFLKMVIGFFTWEVLGMVDHGLTLYQVGILIIFYQTTTVLKCGRRLYGNTTKLGRFFQFSSKIKDFLNSHPVRSVIFLIRASLEMALNYFVSKQAPFEKNKSHTSIRHGRNQTFLTVLPLHTIHHFATLPLPTLTCQIIAKGVGMIQMVNNWRNWTTAVPQVVALFHYLLMMRVRIPILSHKTSGQVQG